MRNGPTDGRTDGQNHLYRFEDASKKISSGDMAENDWVCASNGPPGHSVYWARNFIPLINEWFYTWKVSHMMLFYSMSLSPMA